MIIQGGNSIIITAPARTDIAFDIPTHISIK